MNPIGPVNALYPMPTTLVGATVNAKPNFLTIAHVCILNHGTPQYLSIGLSKVHYSLKRAHDPEVSALMRCFMCNLLPEKVHPAGGER